MTDLKRKVYRRGIQLVPHGTDWKLSSGEAANLAALEAFVGSQPIAVEREFVVEGRRSLLRPDGSDYGIGRTSLRDRFYRPPLTELFEQWKEVDYLIGAIEYHTLNLADIYVQLRADFVAITLHVPDYDVDHSSFQGRTEHVWYEFDAVVSAARRLLDISRFILWRVFGAKYDCPRNFRDTVRNCTGLPAALRDQLEATWTRYGEKLTAYRDCIQHTTSLNQGLGDVRMDRRGSKVWLISAQLPDNPESKSQRKFTYEQATDGLDFALVIGRECLAAMTLLANEIETRRNNEVVAT